jgi:predicted nucleic acid-binding protein
VSVAFDATFLLPLVFPDALGPLDPATGKPLEGLRERIDGLVAELEESKTKIIIPSPALSELLVRADAAGLAYLQKLHESKAFKIEPFDERAALEVALAIRQIVSLMGKKSKKKMVETWAKVKFDHQIVAIAKVNGCTNLYSDDEGIRNFAEQAKLKVVRLRELKIPAKDPQMNMEFEPKTRKIEL